MVFLNTYCIGQFAFCLVVSHYTLTLGAVLPGSQDRSEDRQWQGRCPDIDGRVCGHETNRFCEEETGYCLVCTENYCGEKIYDDSLCQQYCPAWFSKNKIQPTLPDVAPPEVTDNVSTTSEVDYTLSLTETFPENSVQKQSFETKAWYMYIAYVLLGIAIISIIYLMYCSLTRAYRNRIQIQTQLKNIIATCCGCVHAYAPAQTVDQHECPQIRQPTNTGEESLSDLLTLAKAIPKHDLDSNSSSHTSSSTGNFDSSENPPSVPFADDSSSNMTVTSGSSASHNDNSNNHLTTQSARTCGCNVDEHYIWPHPVPVEKAQHDLNPSMEELVTNV